MNQSVFFWHIMKISTQLSFLIHKVFHDYVLQKGWEGRLRGRLNFAFTSFGEWQSCLRAWILTACVSKNFNRSRISSCDFGLEFNLHRFRYLNLKFSQMTCFHRAFDVTHDMKCSRPTIRRFSVKLSKSIVIGLKKLTHVVKTKVEPALAIFGLERPLNTMWLV